MIVNGILFISSKPLSPLKEINIRKDWLWSKIKIWRTFAGKIKTY